MSNSNFSLSLLKIPVSDIEKSAAFYESVLGFEKTFVAAEYGWAQFNAGNVPLALYVPGMGGGDGKVGDSLDFHLAIRDWETLFKRLLDAGDLVEDRVHEGNDGSKFLEIRDPDDNTFKMMILEDK